MDYYIYGLACIIIILVIATFYFRYSKESFQNTSENTTIDYTNVQATVIAPLIAANPDLSGTFNSATGPDITQLDMAKVTSVLSTTTIPANVTNAITDKEKQCAIIRNHYNELEATLPSYYATMSETTIMGIKRALADQENQMSNLGC